MARPAGISAYQIAWDKIKSVPAGQEVIIECDIYARETLIQAIARIKSEENTARAAVDLPTFGKTKVVRYLRENNEGRLCRVGFTLSFSLEQLL